MINVRASQIFTNEIDDAVTVKKALDAGGQFEDLVQEYSICPTKKIKGDLGWMNEENIGSLLGEQVTEKDKGRILGPIHSQYGYHIVKITDVRIDHAAIVFSAETLMSELNERFPDAHSVLFKEFHIGLPVMGYGKTETIASVCETHGKSVEEVLSKLNAEFETHQAPSITPEELKTKRESNKDLVLLDIREQWERDISYIEGSTLLTTQNNESLLNSLNKDAEIIVIDWKGDRFPSFQKWMSQKGFSNVKGIEGGIDAWCEQVETWLSRYDIDEDDGYRYEDIL